MASVAGWAIIAAIFGSVSLALAWPFYRLIHRAWPRSSARTLYIATAICLGVALWYLIPVTIHALFNKSGD